MRSVGRIIVVLSAIVALGVGMTPVNASAATFGVEAFGAYNTYAMDDVNTFIGQANQGGTYAFDELSGGITGGFGLRTWANPSWLITADWEPLRATTESNGAEINAGANSFQVTAAHFFPSATQARYGIGIGGGYYSLSGSVTGSGDPNTDGDITGSGFGFHALGMGEWHVNESFALTGTAGYRYADIGVDDSTTDDTVNYSGAIARVGFAFYMPTQK